MVGNPHVLPISTFPQAFALITSLDDAQFVALRTLTGSDRSFSPPSQEIDQFAKSIKTTSKDVESVISAIHFLYDRLKDLAAVGLDRSDAVASLVEELAPESSDGQRLLSGRLVQLLTQSDVHEKFQKIFRLERGYLPTAISFDSLVDMRPDFSENLDEIRGYIPVITFSISTSSTNPANRSFIFNLPLDKLDDFQGAISRVATKLSKLRKTVEK